MTNKESYGRTRAACYLGYVSQAAVNNLGPLLFSAFGRQFGTGLGGMAALVSLNFGVQLLVDLAALRLADRIGYRRMAAGAGLFCVLGLGGMAFLPFILPRPYLGLVIAALINGVGGGLLEVMVSPIVEALPSGNKSAAMSLLHSFYCWGFVGVVLLSTAYFSVAGIENWRWLPLLWTAPPLASFFLFLRAPIRSLPSGGGEAAGAGRERRRGRFLLGTLFFLMVCAGASEQGMSQWASFFAETGLGVSKTTGDLLGPCAFAALMGLSRVFFGTRRRELPLGASLGGAAGLCLGGYVLAVFSPSPLLALGGCAVAGLAAGILWPGIFSLASRLFPRGGTAMFALLALAGDGGCGLGPALVGLVSRGSGGGLGRGLLAAALFPALLGAGLGALALVSRRGGGRGAVKS
jgi:hypothetical protein